MKQVSNLIPYIIKNNIIVMFLQRRCSKAPVRPDLLGLWGGKIENETPLDALYRETKEELGYEPNLNKVEFLGQFEDETPSHKHVYIEEVSDNFESIINIKEGKAGEWILQNEFWINTDISEKEKKILYALIKKVKLKTAI